jgi:major type 1 subunit fimbrin (pilin)
MKHIARAALAGALVLVGSAHASDGTINITGKVVGNTCTINSGTKDVSVQLPTVAAGNLASADTVTGTTPFTMSLDCKDGATTPAALTGTVKAYFEVGTNVDVTTGRLKLTGTDAATNLHLELLNSDATSIKIGDPSTIKGATFTSGKATLNYKVQYHATGAVKAGTANSSVTYSLDYQ